MTRLHLGGSGTRDDPYLVVDGGGLCLPGTPHLQWDADYAKMLFVIANQTWTAPGSKGGVPQVDSTTKCYSYEHCTFVRDQYNVDTMAANPGAYCTFGSIDWGVPATARCDANGAGSQLFTDASGVVRQGTTWDVYVRGDQDRIAHTSTGSPGGGSKGIHKGYGPGGKPRPELDDGTFEPNYGEGLDSYSGGSYTSPGWARINGDSTNEVGGVIHNCWHAYTISTSDAEGLNSAQIAAVMAYNRC